MTEKEERVFVGFKVRPDFARVIDAMAGGRGVDRSTFLRELVRDEAVRSAVISEQEVPVE